MKHLFAFFLLFIICNGVLAEDIAGKYVNSPAGFKDSIPEISAYLFEAGSEPEGAVYSEPDYILSVQGVAISDPLAGSQTYVEKLRMESVLNTTKCKVAVIDTGIDFHHEDLTGDGDFDVHGHGTAAAGIIGATANNGLGIRGVANTALISVKAFGHDGNSRVFDVAAAIVRAVNLGAKIIYIAGGCQEYSLVLKEACDYAVEKGVYIVAPGGNTSSEKILYPAAFKNVLSAGSLNNEGNPCDYKDWGYDESGNPLGSCRGDIDFMLPGVNIFSCRMGGGYSYNGGTSYSAAILAGLAAYVMAEKNPGSFAELKEMISDLIEYGPSDKTTAAIAAVNPVYETTVDGISENLSVAPLTASGVEPAPDGLVTVIRAIADEELLPGEETTVTMTVTNNGAQNFTDFVLTDMVSARIVLGGSTEVSIGSSGLQPFILKERKELVYSGISTTEVRYEKGKVKAGSFPYTWSFSTFPSGATIVIKYKMSTLKKGIYHFSDFRWVGNYEGVDYTDKEFNGTFVIVELPDITATSSPAGFISIDNPVFTWPSAGDGFTYELTVYKYVKGRLKKVFSSTSLETPLATNTFNWSSAGLGPVESGKQYLWKVRAIQPDTNLKTTYNSTKFISYRYETPYPVQPEGYYYNSEKPSFEWTKVDAAHHYKINLYQKKGRKWTRISEYTTLGRGNNVTTATWSNIARNEYGVEIGNIPGAVYRWDVTAVDISETLVSAAGSVEFAYYPLTEAKLISPIGYINKSLNSNIIKFEWEALPDAVNYVFDIYYRSRNEIGKKMATAVVATTTYEVPVQPLKSYVWIITPINIDGSKGIESRALFSVIPEEIVELTSHLNGYASSTQPAFSWTPGYETVGVQLSLGKKKLINKSYGGSPSGFSLADEGIELAWGKTYVLKIRGEFAGGKLYTLWKTYKIKVNMQSPVFSTPGKTTETLNPEFAWSSVSDAVKYLLTVKLGKTVILSKEITGTSYTYNPSDAGGYTLVEGKKYTAIVAAINAESVTGPASKAIKFIARTIASPEITSPDSRTSTVPLLSWNSVSGASGYEWTVKLGRKKIAGPEIITGTSVDFSELTDGPIFHSGKKYTLNVRCIDSATGVFSKTASRSFFTYELTTPQPIIPGYLRDTGTYERISTVTPEFQWTPVDGVDYYELMIKDIKRRRIKKYRTYTNSFQLPDNYKLKDESRYYYSVRARSQTGFSNWSAKSNFEVYLWDTSMIEHPGRTINVKLPTFVFTIPEEIVRAEIIVYKYDSKGRRRKYKTYKVPKYESSNYIMYRCPDPYFLGYKYSWQVRAVGLNGKSAYSDYLDFDIASNAAYRHETIEEIFNVAGGLTASSITKTSFNVSWNSKSGTTQYHLYKDDVELAAIPGTSYSVTGLTANTMYKMEVAAESAAGVIGPKSTPKYVYTLPGAVSGVNAPAITASGFSLSWTDMDYAQRYYIYIDNVEVGTATINTFEVTGKDTNVTYQIQVAVENPSGMGEKSAAYNVTTLVGAPVNLMATNIAEDSFDLSWKAINNITQYKIYLNGVYNKTVTGNSGNLTSLMPSTNYTIQVAAIGLSGEGPKSNILTVLTKPQVPRDLAVSAPNEGGFKLTWSAVPNTVYNVYLNGIKTYSGISGSTFYVTGRNPNTKYSVQLTAQSGSLTSALCTAVNGVTLPAAGEGLSASAQTTSSFTLSWNAASGTETVTYYIYRNGSLLTTSSATSASITGLNANSVYSMQIAVENSAGRGNRSPEYDVLTAPEAPTTFSSASPDDLVPTTVQFSWDDMDADNPIPKITNYHIYQKTGAAGSFTKVKSVTGTSTSITGLVTNTQYWFKVASENDTAESAQSDQIFIYVNTFETMTDLHVLRGSWGIINVSGNNHLQTLANNTEHRLTVLPTAAAGNNYVVKTRAIITQGNGYGVYYRATDNANITAYCLQFDPGLNPKKIAIRKVLNGAEQTPVLQQDFPVGFNIYGIYHVMETRIFNNHHYMVLDGTPNVDATDLVNPFTTGMVGFRKWHTTDVKFDYVVVRSVLQE